MRLRVRLATSYLAVIVLFLVILGIGWLLLGGTEVLEQLHQESLALATRLARTTERKAAADGWPATEELLAETPLLEGTSVVLFRPEPKQLQGDRQPGDRARLRAAWSGETSDWLENALHPSRRRVQLWLPVGKNPVQAVLWLSVPAAPSEPVRARVFQSLLGAALLASALTFAVGLGMSRSIARPVSRLAAATEALGREELSVRVQVDGRDELADLAASFNRMAQRLEESQQSLREQKERAVALERGKREFLRDVSHNLKTPLAAIQGWTEALQDGLVPGQEAITLERIRRQVGFVARTVSRLLELSRWEAGEAPPLHWSEFELSEPLMEAVDALADAAQARHIELALQRVTPGARVRADRERLRELLQICLENAVFHAGEGTRVQVSCEWGERVRVDVSDDGAGMDVNRQGLGLSIAHRLAAAHGGELELASQPGQGTRVSFTVARGS